MSTYTDRCEREDEEDRLEGLLKQAQAAYAAGRKWQHLVEAAPRKARQEVAGWQYPKIPSR